MVLLNIPLQRTEQFHEKLMTAGNPANTAIRKRANMQTIT